MAARESAQPPAETFSPAAPVCGSLRRGCAQREPRPPRADEVLVDPALELLLGELQVVALGRVEDDPDGKKFGPQTPGDSSTVQNV